MEWTPIESAPKRGHILVTGFGYNNNGVKTKRRFYSQAVWSENHNNFVDPWRDDDNEEYVELTHWMKIPKIVKEQK